MTPLGHLSAAAMLARGRLGRTPALAGLWCYGSCALGALLPDLVDKPMLWLGMTPYGRGVGHALLSWAWMGVIAALWPARSALKPLLALFVWAGFSHLAFDAWDDLNASLLFHDVAFSGWAGWPWFNPDQLKLKTGAPPYPCRSCWTPAELLIIFWASWAHIKR